MPISYPHRRQNPLTGEWILVSPQRAQRPWQQPPAAVPNQEPAYDPECYLCPGNKRTSLNGTQQVNPNYDGVFIFTNDFPALVPQPPAAAAPVREPFFISEAVTGTCRVICYSQQHNLQLGDMTTAALSQVISAWIKQCGDLGESYDYVQIFENKGDLVGCSSPHPHGQIWALDYTPYLVSLEQQRQLAYYKQHKSSLLLDYLKREETDGSRLVLSNEHWSLVVPYWSYWPYETLLLPRQQVASLLALTTDQQQALAEIFKHLAILYDRLFNRYFPYIMGWHGDCKLSTAPPASLLHCHLYPPLLDRVKKKYMAGFEVLAELQRDLTPEQAAARLRALTA